MADAEGASAPVAPRESQALLRLLVESVHEYAIFALDATGHVASWNPGAERRLQLAQEQAARVEAERVTRQLQEVTAEARRAHEQLRLVFEGIAEGIIVQSRDGRIVLANDTGARMCGFDTAAEVMAAPISEILARFELFDEGGRPFPLEDLPARRVLRGEDHAEAVLRSRPQGSQADRWSLSRATALRDEAGEIAYAVSIFEDIGER